MSLSRPPSIMTCNMSWASPRFRLSTGSQFVKGEVVDAVDVAGTESDRGEPAGERFGSDDGDVRETSFAIPDQIEGLGAGVLSPIAA